MKYDSAKLAYFSNSNDTAIGMTHRLYESYLTFTEFSITTEIFYLMHKGAERTLCIIKFQYERSKCCNGLITSEMSEMTGKIKFVEVRETLSHLKTCFS